MDHVGSLAPNDPRQGGRRRQILGQQAQRLSPELETGSHRADALGATVAVVLQQGVLLAQAASVHVIDLHAQVGQVGLDSLALVEHHPDLELAPVHAADEMVQPAERAAHHSSAGGLDEQHARHQPPAAPRSGASTAPASDSSSSLTRAVASALVTSAVKPIS